MRAKSTSVYSIGLVILFLSVGFFLWRKTSVTASGDKTAQPRWVSDLSRYGYPAKRPGAFNPAEMPISLQQGMLFTDRNVLAIFFAAHDSSQNNASASTADDLEAIFLNTDQGELIQKLEWPLHFQPRSAPNAFLSPATGGQFITVLGHTLSLYSPDFKLVSRYDPQQEFLVTASPSGETILLQVPQRGQGTWRSELHLLDADRLSVRKSWSDNSPTSAYALWGDELASISSGSLPQPGIVPKISPKSLYFRKAGEAPRKVLDSRKEFCAYWSFINKDTIAVPDCGEDKLLIVSTQGQIIREIDLGPAQMYGPAVAARDGQRFAVLTYEWGSSTNSSPQKLSARVFELSADSPLLTVDLPRWSNGGPFLTPMGNTQFGPYGVALAPDGDLLAVKSGSILQFYEVPSRSSPKTLTRANDSSEETPSVSLSPATQTESELATRGTSASSQLAQQVLSWLPADTETLVAANGPFLLPQVNAQADQTTDKDEEVDHKAGDIFKGLLLGLLGFKEGFLEKYLKNEKILFALEGSRHFRAPSGLGMSPFEGCSVAIFDADITSRANSFLRDASKSAARVEQIEGYQVAVFQEKREEDIWTTFVSFPKPNLVVAATNRGYLREFLARLNSASGERALPDNLPEWKHINIRDQFWALRHYSKKDSAMDPTSPIGGRGVISLKDDQAIGITFSFDPDKSKTATITFISGDKNVFPKVQRNLFPVESEPGAREMHVRYREVEPGIIEGSYDLSHIESTELFVFVLESLLGQAVYL